MVIRPVQGGTFVAIVDVLGHGAEAHELARTIHTYLTRYGAPDVAAVMTRLHQHLRGTRGAAAGLCAVDEQTGRALYVGTGNTVVRRFGRTDTRLVSMDGVLGQNMRSPRPQALRRTQ